MGSLPAEERGQIEHELESQTKEARLSALLIVTNAYDTNKIQKRNLQTIDEQIAASVQAYMRESRPRLRMLMHEEVEADSAGQPTMRELPMPPGTTWHKKRGLEPSKRKRSGSDTGGRYSFLTEIERF